VIENSVGKLHLVLNLKHLNKFLNVVSFTYEDLRTAAPLFEKGEYMFKFDPSQTIITLMCTPTAISSWASMQWKNKNVTKYFVFTVLPFGLSSGCYLFTKLLKPLVRYWRGCSLKAIVYLDDGIVAVQGFERALHEGLLVKEDLEKVGLVVNLEKTQWTPSNRIEWLGLIVDLSKGEFSVPDDKIKAQAL